MENQVEQLWMDFSKKLKSFIMSRVKEEALADDILQDVFVKIHTSISQLENSARLHAWAYQITRNTITDHYRKSKPMADAEAADKADEEQAEKNYNEIFQDDLRCFISRLPEKYREALILTEFQGLDQIQLARHLGISHSGAKSRVQRAKEKLKELFVQCCRIQSDRFGNIVDFQVRNSCCGDDKSCNQ